jgi:catechol 2,3-dioxygenase-like lactoylglutathione lyase family enzyme
VFREIAHQHIEDVAVQKKPHNGVPPVYIYIDYSACHYSLFIFLFNKSIAPYTEYREGGCMIKAVKFVSIPVRDQEQALAFYTEKLGFRILTDQPFDAKQHWIELRIPGSETSVVLFTPPGHEDRIGTFSNITFLTDDVDRTHRELTARGVVFTAPPAKQPWGQFAKFQDADGNQFVLSTK